MTSTEAEAEDNTVNQPRVAFALLRAAITRVAMLALFRTVSC